MPSRPAIAVRWTTALVEPPMARSMRSALSKALGRHDGDGAAVLAPTSETAMRPVSSAMRRRSASTAGMRSRAGEAPCRALQRGTPSCRRCPSPRTCRRWRRGAFDGVDLVVVDRRRRGTAPRSDGSRCTRPRRSPSIAAAHHGPATSWIAGRSAEAAPMSWAGRSCRSRRRARQRPSAGRGSSPPRPWPSGCGRP